MRGLTIAEIDSLTKAELQVDQGRKLLQGLYSGRIHYYKVDLGRIVQYNSFTGGWTKAEKLRSDLSSS